MVGARKWIKGIERNQPVSEAARRVISQRLRTVQRYLRLAATEATKNTAYVHQLRVAVRRAVAALDVFSDLLPRRRVRKVRRRLQVIRRRAGDARDLDVLCLSLRAQSAANRRSGLERILRYARRQRTAAQQELVDVYRQVQREGFKQDVRKLIGRIRWRQENAELSFEQAARRMLRPVVDQFFAAGTADLSDVNAVHQMRICAKRLRYVTEISAAGLAEELRDKVYPKLVRIQDVLGQINDHATAEKLFRKWNRQTDRRDDRKTFHRLCKLEQQNIGQRCAEIQSWWTADLAAELRYGFENVLSQPLPAAQASSQHRQRKQGAQRANHSTPRRVPR